MKRQYLVLLILPLLLLIFLWQKKNNPPEPIIVVKEYSISGMTCGGCEATINTNVSKIEGVVSVNSSYLVGKAVIEYDSLSVSSVDIEKIVVESGYKVVNIQPLKTVKPLDEK